MKRGRSFRSQTNAKSFRTWSFAVREMAIVILQQLHIHSYTFHPLSPLTHLDHPSDDIAQPLRHAVNHRRNTLARQQERVSSAVSAALGDRSLRPFSKGHTQASRRCATGSERWKEREGIKQFCWYVAAALLCARHTDSRLSVPFEEDEKDPSVWFLDHNYIESMNDMFKKVNAREKLIGWYHTGPKLRASDLEINELFKRYTPNPLLVIIDVQPKDVGVPTDAYFAVDEIKDVRWHQAQNILCFKTYTHRRTEPQPQRPSSTHPRPSKPKKQKRLELSTCSVIFVTLPLVLSRLV